MTRIAGSGPSVKGLAVQAYALAAGLGFSGGASGKKAL